MNLSVLLVACRRSLAALLVAGCVLSSAPAFAQGETRARVEQLLKQGMERRAAGRDAEALEAYRQAVALEPENARVLAHLGVTYQALGRWVPAQKYLTQALASAGDPYIERHTSELTAALSVVSDHLGQLEVYGGPPGAEVMLNGQLVATLPMSEPAQVTVGSYLMEVQAPGHYTLGRPISVIARQLTREEVGLSPHRVGARSDEVTKGAPSDAALPAPAASAGAGGAPRWLPWVLGGAAAVSATGAVIFWQQREQHAENWNDDAACVGAGASREERCGDELEKGERAETWMVISGTAAALFAAGAVMATIWIEPASEEQAGLSGCAPGLGGAVCFGRF